MNEAPIFDRLQAAANRIQDGVSDFQREADALQDFGQRLRAMTDRLQQRPGRLDDVEPMHLPAIITPLQKAVDVAEVEIADAVQEFRPKRARG